MLFAMAVLACSRPSPAPAAPVVVTIDTLRADHLDALGVPFSGCRRYTRAHSAAPYTTSSTYALLTGRLPSGQFKAQPKKRPGPVAAADLWLDEVLTDQPVVQALVGEPQSEMGNHQVRSVELAAAATEWLADDGNDAESLYLHAFGPHAPWDRYLHRAGRVFRTEPMQDIITGKWAGGIDDGLAAWGRVQYRQAVAETGWNMAPVFAEALGAGRLLIVTSDHGEALGEDGLWMHGNGLHDPQIHVPLVVCGPGVVPGKDSTPVGPLCVAETVTGRGPCDLRTGEGLRAGTAGMLVEGDWVTRDVGAEWAGLADGGSAG